MVDLKVKKKNHELRKTLSGISGVEMLFQLASGVTGELDIKVCPSR